jgi:phospholipid N-methyltransferase
MNAEGLIQNDESSIIFIETLTQHYQSLEILEVLQNCIQLKMDFPFEHLITDCIMYGMLANESSLDPKIEVLEKIFQSYLQLPLPEVRERILRKIYGKLRL